MDKFTPKQRSYIMSMIRGKNTKPELLVFRELRKRKVYFQRHYKKVSGNPDIAFPRKKVAVFINGEFWHGRYFSNIKDKLPEFWRNKLANNMRRDRKNYRLLKKDGWKVVKIWDINLTKNPILAINKIIKSITV